MGCLWQHMPTRNGSMPHRYHTTKGITNCAMKDTADLWGRYQQQLTSMLQHARRHTSHTYTHACTQTHTLEAMQVSLDANPSTRADLGGGSAYELPLLSRKQPAFAPSCYTCTQQPFESSRVTAARRRHHQHSAQGVQWGIRHLQGSSVQ